jgi:hypothetical protein
MSTIATATMESAGRYTRDEIAVRGLLVRVVSCAVTEGSAERVGENMTDDMMTSLFTT